MQKINSCCFTGHRPTKFSFGYDEENDACIKLKLQIAIEIEAVRQKGITHFYTGMAQGVDIWSAETVIRLREAYPNEIIKLIAIVPFEGQANRWDESYRNRYYNILSQADDVITLNHQYKSGCMYERNRFLVDHTSYMIAVYNNSKGGTEYTINYAKRKNLQITIIDPNSFASINVSKPTLHIIK